MARGIGIGQGLNAFTQGAAQGIGLVNMIDERKNLAEDRGLAMIDRQRRIAKEDEQMTNQRADRQREEQARYVMGQWARAKSGLDVDTEGLRRIGINPGKHFDDRLGQWADVSQEVLAGKRTGAEPDTLDLFNWRYSDSINKGVGEKIKAGFTSVDGQQIPVGAEIVGKRIVGLKPAPGGDALLAALQVAAKTPDGKQINYVAPMTEGRSADQSAGMLRIPVRDLITRTQADILLADAARSPDFRKELEAKIVELTGKPVVAPKVDDVKREVGGEIVTYERDEAGNLREVARAPRWNAKEPRQPRAPTDVEEYQNLVKQHGQEKADELWSRIKSRNGRGDLPLSPNQILANAAKARRAAQTYVDNFTKSSVDEVTSDQRKQMLDEMYDDELAALGLDRMAVADAAQRTGKSDPARGAKPKSEAPVQAVREGATATNPKTGAKIIFRNGKWEPVNG